MEDDLEAIYAEYQVDRAFQHMRQLGSNFVPGVGNPEMPRIMFIGEAPGRTEDRRQEPFVGPSGKLLWEACDLVFGECRVNCWTTNVVKYRPVTPRGHNRTPDPEEIEASRPYLRREVVAVGPRVLVPLGASALACVDYGAAQGRLRRGELTEIVGWTWLPTWHPAYVLRQGGLDSKAGTEFINALRRAGDR